MRKYLPSKDRLLIVIAIILGCIVLTLLGSECDAIMSLVALALPAVRVEAYPARSYSPPHRALELALLYVEEVLPDADK